MNHRISPFPLRSATAATAWLLAGLLSAPAASGYIGEPETIIYGRILNRRNPNVEQLVTAGALQWTIRRADGTEVRLSGEIDELDGGNQSYLVRVPHQAIMLGQVLSPQAVPLGTTPTTALHAAISVSGAPARILPPATSGLALDQLLRAGALRVDLEIDAPSPDTDNDGIPDWWEEKYGLDKQNGADALADANGNSLNNRGEYLAGSDPNFDPLKPRLLTREFIAYEGADSLVPLEVADADSSPAQLVYTLGSLPSGGSLVLRNAAPLPGETARQLTAGSTFTAADVLSGRLLFQHENGAEVGSFQVSVRDENPAHEASSGEIAIRLFQSDAQTLALTAAERLRLESHRLARENGYLIADFGAAAGPHRLAAATAGLAAGAMASHDANYGAEVPHILLGGPAADVLTGGAAADILNGGAGANTLAGGGGPDTFVYTALTPSAEIIADFTPAQGDAIDLTGVLPNVPSARLASYVRLRRSGADALLEVSAAGTGIGYSDLVVRLQGSTLQPADLPTLHYAGNLKTGVITLPPRVSIAAAAAASENGPVAGAFTLIREGDLTAPLLVNLLVSGNATNGVDYESVYSVVEIAAGEATASIAIRPYVDSLVEFNEVVQISLVSSAAYLVGTASSAQLAIEDLKPQLSLEVLERLASVGDAAPGAILMRRAGLTSPEVFVQFTLSGTAVNGIDYNRVTPYLTLGSGQTTRLVEFVPKVTVNFGAAEAKSIVMTLKADAAYAIPAPAAELMLVPRMLSYPAWQAENEMSGPGFADRLSRYAFSMDAANPYGPASAARLPRAVMQGDYLTLHFRRKPGVTDLQYQVEYTNDFSNWSSGSAVVEDITSQVAPNDPGAAVFRAKRPMSAAAKAAMRVRLVIPD